MPATATVSPTGNSYIDGVLDGTKWAVGSLTFSFPTDSGFYGSGYGYGEPNNNFQAFNPAQQAATRTVLQSYTAVINVNFTESTETSTQHADLRFSESDTPGTAWSYYPSTSASGGDAWFNNSSHSYDNPQKGNYAWLTIVHEFGHAMGLKHPHEASGSFGPMPVDHDSLEYSVMSYHSYVGSTVPYYTNETWSYPQSLMMYDIAALQAMYGANYATNAGDTTYSWNQTTGEMQVNGAGQGAPGGNRVFLTIWDGGGKDTYNLSNYSTDLNVNLQPGTWSLLSSLQLAALGDGHFAAGNVANALLYQNNPASLIENVIGGSGNDKIVGNAANNTFTGGAGNDTIDGVAGVNTAVFSGRYSDYSMVKNADGSWTVSDLRAGSPDGTDQLKHIDYLKFQDLTVAGQVVQNSAPNATDDYYGMAANKKLVVSASGVLANDSDADGNALTATLVSTPQHGKLTFNKDGTFAYTPNRKFTGIDSFTYKVSDGSDSDVASVWIKVGKTAPVAPLHNSRPESSNDSFVTAIKTSLKVSASAGLLKNDTDADGNALSVILVSKPKYGRLTVKPDGSFSYTPSKKFAGVDSFTYKVSDGWSFSDVTTATIKVGASAGQTAAATHQFHDQMPSQFLDSPSLNHTLYEKVQSLLDSYDHNFDWRPLDTIAQNHLADHGYKAGFDLHLLVR